MNHFLEWLGRVVMLVLAGMITLSMIGAIASIPSGSIETRLGVEPQSWPEPRVSEQASAPPAAQPEPQPESPRPTATPAPNSELTAVPRQPEKPAAADWLESIAYALLALVGLFVLGILLLWRALGHWRRTADALEALAARRP